METVQLNSLITAKAQQPISSPLEQGQKLHYLMKLTQDFILKYKALEPFQKEIFAEQSKERFLDIENHLNQYTSQLKQQRFNAMRAYEISSLHELMASLFAFITQKWNEEYRKTCSSNVPQRPLDERTASMICRQCHEEVRHKEIKEARHQIYNLRIWDPYYYFQETMTHRDSAAEESCHKKLQAKLSDLAAGAQMQQRYMKEILSEIESREEEIAKSREESSYRREEFRLPLMPMLLSVFKHAKNPSKKQLRTIGCQTQHGEFFAPNSTKTTAGSSHDSKKKGEETIKQGNFVLRQQKARESSLLIQLNQKAHFINKLQASIEEGEKVKEELKNQNVRLMNENIQLNSDFAVLEARLRKQFSQTSSRKSSNDQAIKKTRDTSRRSTQHRFTRIKEAKKEQGEEEENENEKEKENTHERRKEQRKSQEREMRKMKSNFQKKKASVKTRDSNLYSAISTTPTSPARSPLPLSNLKSEPTRTPDLLNQRQVTEQSESSYKQIETGFTQFDSEDVVLPSLNSPRNHPRQASRFGEGSTTSSPRLSSNPTLSETTTPKAGSIRKRQPRSTLDYKLLRAKKRRTARNTDQGENEDERNKNSENLSEELAGLMRVECKQQLLQRLFMEEMREREGRGEAVIDFDQFRQGYDNYILKVVGVRQGSDTLSRPNNLNKKSTAHLRQILRNQIIQQRNESAHSQADPRYKQKQQCKEELKETIHEMLLAVKGQPLLEQAQREGKRTEAKSKLILVGGQLNMVTEISAYLMQLKVRNVNAYILVKNMLETEQRMLPNSGRPEQELRRRLAVLISGHRHCNRGQKGYCPHLSSFISKVVQLVELENP